MKRAQMVIMCTGYKPKSSTAKAGENVNSKADCAAGAALARWSLLNLTQSERGGEKRRRIKRQKHPIE